MAIPHPPARRHRLRRRNTLVQSHLNLVAPIAAHYAARSAESHDDLEQVGRLGLIRAAELYDDGRLVPFSAYARRHIRGAILHHLRDGALIVRAPRRVQERSQRHQRMERQLEQALGRRPQPQELRVALGLSPEQWCRQTEFSGLGSRQWLSMERLEQIPQPVDEAEGTRGDALTGLRQLEQRQRQVVEAVVLEGLSLRDVARRQRSSAATVHRLLHRGLAALRTRLSPPSAVPGC